MLYDDKIPAQWFALLLDSTFRVGRVVDDKIIRGIKANNSGDVLSPKMASIDLKLHQVLSK